MSFHPLTDVVEEGVKESASIFPWLGLSLAALSSCFLHVALKFRKEIIYLNQSSQDKNGGQFVFAWAGAGSFDTSSRARGLIHR